MNKLICCSVSVLVLVGCTPQTEDPDRPDTYPVTGVVTYNGEPVEGATVTFMATAEGGRGASGTTDSSGKYSLFTFVAGDGAIAGNYAVKISKTNGGTVANTAEEAKAMMEAAAGGPPKMSEIKDLLPAKYKAPQTSGLTAEVKAGDNKFDFELTD